MERTIDLNSLRSDFPVLSLQQRGKDFVYLDNGATSLKPRQVVDAITEYYTTYSANIHRGVYEISQRATEAHDDARRDVLEFIDGTGRGELLFTAGSTHSINMVAASWGEVNLREGDEIVITVLEHHSNLVPWQQAAGRSGAKLVFVPVERDGTVLMDRVREVLSSRTRIVTVTGMSNVIGYIPPIREIAEAAHGVGAAILIDGAQLVAHEPVSVTDLGVDFLAFSAHKMCGPTGIGALYVASERIAEMEPYQFGGDMIQSVSQESATWAMVPAKFEAGTPNIAGAIGFGAAVRYLREIGMDRVAEHERSLGTYLHQRLKELPFIEKIGVDGTGIASFNIRGIHPHDVGSLLDQQGIAVRTGFHCAQPLMDHFHLTGTVRASLYLYNNESDVDRLIAGLERVNDVLG